MKEVKNTEELINYLISKGVKVNNIDLTTERINNYTYYGIVNTYKYVFKNSDNSYKDKVSFEEIFALYEFDMNIKSLFLKYILELELIIKSRIANLLTEKYGIKDYLIIDNFERSRSNDPYITDVLESIEKEINISYSKHEAIAHYKNKYNYIPPFVLVKALSFGMISRLYGLMKQTDQQHISKEFDIPSNILKVILKNLTFIRNVCAHSDRLYCYHSINTISTAFLKNNYTLPNNTNNLYIIILAMEKMLKEDKYKAFKKQFDLEIDKLSKELKSITIKDILNIIGIND